MSDAFDLSDEEWLLRRIPPSQQPLHPKGDGGFRAQSASFTASTKNGGMSFDRAASVIVEFGSVAAFPIPDGFLRAAIQVKHLRALDLKLKFTDPKPHHVEAFGLKELGSGKEEKARKTLAKASLIVLWPDGRVTWPPRDRQT